MARLGVEAPSLHVQRARLLDSLPDTAPYVVTLEAPPGFGKTDLALSWAARLSGEGWRTLVVSQRGRDLRTAIAASLAAPADLDWGVLESELWRVATLLVIDDLEQHECRDHLELLLQGVDGLLLLASRRPITSAGLVTAALRGRVMTLAADDLEFDRAEASTLFGDDTRAAAVLAEAGGWPLPVAYTAATGLPMAADAVSHALRAGLSQRAWRRLLLQAAVPDAPSGLDEPESVAELVAAGFIEVVDDVPRLAPVVAKALLGARATEVRQAVEGVAGSLTERQLCAAHEATGDFDALAAVLDASTSPIERDDPHSLLRWHSLAPPTASAARRIKAGNALCAVGRKGEGIELLLATAHDESLTADARLTALGDVIYYLSESAEDRDDALTLLDSSGSLLDAASPERRGRFLSTASAVHFRSGEYEAAKDMVRRALAVLPRGSKHRYAPLINLAVLEWNLTGDVEARIKLQHEGLEICREEYPEHVVGVCRDLAQLCLYLGRKADARAYLAEALRYEVARPMLALEAEAMLAQLDGDLDAVADVMDRARTISDPPVLDTITSRYVTSLTQRGRADVALRTLSRTTPPGSFSALALALARFVVGDTEEAAHDVDALEDRRAEREYRVAWLAARYRIGREPSDLDALSTLTSAGPRLLPLVVPLTELPRDRPDLSAPYPLTEVMRSGWREAVTSRLADLPPLRVTFLGATRVEVLGDSVEITGRQRDLLALLLLGLGRRELGAALWPDAGPQKVRNNLNVQLNLLRRALEPWGVKTYLHEDGLHHTDSDLRRLRDALRDGRVDEVMALYGGPFAQGATADAVLEARAALERAVVDALVEASATATSQRAAAYLKRALDLEPLNEEALQRLLVVLGEGGRHGEAMRRYQQFAADLLTQVGLEPLPATTRLVDRSP